MAKQRKITKRINPAEVCFPLPSDLSANVMPIANSDLQKHLLRLTLQVAFQKRMPSHSELSYGVIDQKVSDEDIQMVISLWQSLAPLDSVEAALAMQFIVTHIQGFNSFQSDSYNSKKEDIIALSHQALEMLQKYRAKGAQQYLVQYNINKGQVVNIRGEKHE